MMELILNTARRDERIRAVGMTGSRTNPNAPKDRFRDYDIVYVVNEMESLIADREWIDGFGERVILQRPDESALAPSEAKRTRYAYLMQLADGNRIDLTLCPAAEAARWNEGDTLAVVLLDKDSLLPELPAPGDSLYWIKEPSEAEFRDCCNEFRWVSTYIAKGLRRRELLYALDHLNLYVRPMLIRMLEWRAGIREGFSVSTGKNGKYLDRYTPAEDWNLLLETYPEAKEEAIWRALLTAGELFRRTGQEVAEGMGFRYPWEEDVSVTAYLEQMYEGEG
ncbi:aminoglycoside 6-adenylyltransferase [Paenibacillus spiritus]|uniref:Aminoglycoside 6-adenylyltransferase n=2 Tax=Paenibacillus spiritus TaxID=2496557 RepID=A0A5J5GI31_9BACL|nr:aminoglycoside 6-adenylyltransferase [Paenibacillus spiritus]